MENSEIESFPITGFLSCPLNVNGRWTCADYFFFQNPPPLPQKLNIWLLIGYFVVDLLDDAFWGC